jgi:pimeloyl-ACP methyl ester carboxylesterase
MKRLLSPLPMLNGSLVTVGPTATFESLLASIQLTNGGPWLTLDESVRSQAMTALEAVSAAEFRKVFRALYEFVPPDLSHVETPMLVLYGDHEVAPGKRQGERLSETVAHGSWQEISDAGHLVNQDNPDAFNAACEEFFARLDHQEEQSTAD